MFEFLFLDLDDTILDFKMAERTALTKTLQDLQISPTEEMLSRYSEINAAQWRLLENGEITRREVKERRYQLLFEEFGVYADPVLTTAIYEKHLAVGHFFIDGAVELLGTLSRDYALCLASNGTAAVQHGRIASAGIAPYFCDMFISQEIGADKPSLQFFETCFTKIPDFNKENTVMVGDSLTSDIRGGIGAGIKTVWFNPLHLPNITPYHPTATISHLSQLYALFKTL